MVPKPRPEIARLAAASPAEQPTPGERLVKLNSTEAPFPPSPGVMSAIRDLEPEALRAYPSPDAQRFRQVAAELHGLLVDNVIAGNGSDELLSLAMRTFVSPKDRVATPWPCYRLYTALAELQGAAPVRIEWQEGWGLPMNALLAARAQAIILSNPNDVSGTCVAPDELATLAGKFKGLLVIDEAYADFADTNSVGLLAKHENVLITRSLSIGYALAGVRFAYALGHEQVIALLARVKDRWNPGALSRSAATAALQDQDHVQRMWQHVREERARMTLELQLFGFDVPESQSNFVMARHPELAARELHEGLLNQGVLVHYWSEEGFADALRITVGTSQENNALLGALEALLGTRQQRSRIEAPAG